MLDAALANAATWFQRGDTLLLAESSETHSGALHEQPLLPTLLSFHPRIRQYAPCFRYAMADTRLVAGALVGPPSNLALYRARARERTHRDMLTWAMPVHDRPWDLGAESRPPVTLISGDVDEWVSEPVVTWLRRGSLQRRRMQEFAEDPTSLSLHPLRGAASAVTAFHGPMYYFSTNYQQPQGWAAVRAVHLESEQLHPAVMRLLSLAMLRDMGAKPVCASVTHDHGGRAGAAATLLPLRALLDSTVHLTYFMDPSGVLRKLNSFMHVEVALTGNASEALQRVERSMQAGTHISSGERFVVNPPGQPCPRAITRRAAALLGMDDFVRCEPVEGHSAATLGGVVDSCDLFRSVANGDKGRQQDDLLAVAPAKGPDGPYSQVWMGSVTTASAMRHPDQEHAV